MNLSGKTKPYAVLGHPIGHSLSPAMHNASLQALGLDAVYLAFDVHPDRLMSVLPAMHEMGFGGVNLTVPLKEAAYRGIENLDDTARRLGAVNTVEFLENGSLRGHNTDGDGFLLAVREAFHMDLVGLKVFVIGSGGAGRAVAIACAAAGAAKVKVTDMDTARAERVAEEIGGLIPERNVSSYCTSALYDWTEASSKADLIVQATPVGMDETDASLLPPSAFRSGQSVLDLVYMYPETAFMKCARQAGAKAANGLNMLMYQGARAFTIWTGQSANEAAMRQALETAVYGKTLS